MIEQIWEKVLGVGILEAANRELYKPEDLAKEITSQAKPVNRIGFIGLGAMGFGMAAHLLKSKFSVRGYDVSPLYCECSRESMVYMFRMIVLNGLDWLYESVVYIHVYSSSSFLVYRGTWFASL